MPHLSAALRACVLLLAAMVTAACGGSGSPAGGVRAPETQAPAAPTAVSDAPAAPPTAVSDAPTAAVAVGGIPSGKTPEGYNYLGSPTAPVTIQDFSDFFWTTCAFHVVETEPKIVKAYIETGRVRLIYRHLLQLGDGSLRAAEASECAGDQGKFWEMRYAIYAGQSELYGSSSADAALAVFAQDIGLDAAAYNDCMISGRHEAAIRADADAASAAGIRSRPVFDVGGTRLVGARPFADFEKAIEAAGGR